MKNPSNNKWIEAQEKLYQSTLDSKRNEKLIKQQLYPELEHANALKIASKRSEQADTLYEEARSRSMWRSVLAEFVKKHGTSDSPDKVTTSKQIKTLKLKTALKKMGFIHRFLIINVLWTLNKKFIDYWATTILKGSSKLLTEKEPIELQIMNL